MLHKALSSMGGLQAWTAILERLPKARFLLGQGKRGFWISFEALCSESIRVKLLEGAYDHVPGEAKAPAKPVQVSQVSNERWRERVKNWLTAARPRSTPRLPPGDRRPEPRAASCQRTASSRRVAQPSNCGNSRTSSGSTVRDARRIA